MEIVILSIAAFFTAILTFFSGFGLGTILTPLFMIFFPVELAIALTGIVHFFNNIFKLVLIGRKSDIQVLIRFGIPAVLAAFIGAWVLIFMEDIPPLFEYSLGGNNFEVMPVKLIISVLIILFTLIDIIPAFKGLSFDQSKLPVGGLISGFFGGLSGNQGALRSAFLIKSGLSKEAFIGTTAVVSAFVDFTRLGVYLSRMTSVNISSNQTLIISATLAAILGALIGNKILKKITMKFVQNFVAILLILISIALGTGLI